MPHARQDLTLCDTIAAQPIRDDLARLTLQAGQQALEKAFGSCGIPALLHQDVEHDAVPDYGAPEIA